MDRLPLFPLGSVLFPGMPLNLHIFEERYKLMIGRCVEAREPFGVVALQHGSEVKGYSALDAVPYEIGCTAVITQVQQLVEGRLNIVAVGTDRFRIERVETSEPYLVGVVERLPLKKSAPLDLFNADRRLRPWVERYLQTLGRAENMQLDVGQLPKDPLQLAFLAASLLRTEVEEKQRLLSMNSPTELLESLRVIYRKETTLLDTLVNIDMGRDEGPFSLN